MLPAGAEPVAAVDEENVELQLVVANSAYRVNQTQFKDRASTVKALEETAAGYLTVLKNNTWHPDAAFNYEYIIRLRDEAAKGSQPPPAEGERGRVRQRRVGRADAGDQPGRLPDLHPARAG